MPRPCKSRRICGKPLCKRFGPQGTEQSRIVITMTLDEFECIRLIDYEGLTQEQCAEQMDVARTTIQAIYSSARTKMADCLVNAKKLYIDGGSYTLCGQNGYCYKRYCKDTKLQIIKKGDKTAMRIGVTYENGQVFQHFGHTEQFKIYDITDGRITSAAIVDTNGSGHGALAGFLLNNQVDTLICGGIGGGAQMALKEAGIQLYGGVSGDADAAVEALLKNELAFNPDAACSHHGEHHGSNCGEHSCGEHTCGSHS